MLTLGELVGPGEKVILKTDAAEQRATRLPPIPTLGAKRIESGRLI